MTDDQIIAVAKVVRNGGHWDQLDIINFGRLIAAAEREACALECERVTSARSDAEGYGYEYTARDAQRCAAAIRARGQA